MKRCTEFEEEVEPNEKDKEEPSQLPKAYKHNSDKQWEVSPMG